MGYNTSTITAPLAIATKRFDPKVFSLPTAWIKLEKTTHYETSPHDHIARPQMVRFRLFSVHDVHLDGMAIRFNPWEMLEVAKKEIVYYRDGPSKDPERIKEWHQYHYRPDDLFVKNIEPIQELSIALRDMIYALSKLKITVPEALSFDFRVTRFRDDPKKQFIYVYKPDSVGETPSEKHPWPTDDLLPPVIAAAA